MFSDAAKNYRDAVSSAMKTAEERPSGYNQSLFLTYAADLKRATKALRRWHEIGESYKLCVADNAHIIECRDDLNLAFVRIGKSSLFDIHDMHLRETCRNMRDDLHSLHTIAQGRPVSIQTSEFGPYTILEFPGGSEDELRSDTYKLGIESLNLYVSDPAKKFIIMECLRTLAGEDNLSDFVSMFRACCKQGYPIRPCTYAMLAWGVWQTNYERVGGHRQLVGLLDEMTNLVKKLELTDLDMRIAEAFGCNIAEKVRRGDDDILWSAEADPTDKKAECAAAVIRSADFTNEQHLAFWQVIKITHEAGYAKHIGLDPKPDKKSQVIMNAARRANAWV